MNPLDLAYINRLAPYKVWTENGCDYLVETSYDLLFKIGFMDDYSIWQSGAYQRDFLDLITNYNIEAH